MMTWARRSFFSLLLSGLLLGALASPVLGASNFVRVPLGKGASIEVPKNWVVHSENQRTTLDTFVEAQAKAIGLQDAEHTLNFVANLYDDRGKRLAHVNARFYPDNPMTQAEARQVTSADLKEINVGMRKANELILKALGSRMLNWYGSKMRVINGVYVLVHEHQQPGVGDAGVTRVRGLRVWRSPRSFTVTLSYQERDATLLLPIIDYMTNSLRQD